MVPIPTNTVTIYLVIIRNANY